RYRVHGSGAVPPLFLPETLLRSFDDHDLVDPLDADLAPMAADDCSHWMTVGFRQGTAVLAVGEKAVPKGFEFRLFVVAIDGAEHDVFALWVCLLEQPWHGDARPEIVAHVLSVEWVADTPEGGESELPIHRCEFVVADVDLVFDRPRDRERPVGGVDLGIDVLDIDLVEILAADQPFEVVDVERASFRLLQILRDCASARATPGIRGVPAATVVRAIGCITAGIRADRRRRLAR